MKMLALFFVAFVFGACGSCKPIPPGPPDVTTDASPPPLVDAASDSEVGPVDAGPWIPTDLGPKGACVNLARLGCPEAATSDGGVTCEVRWKNYADHPQLGVPIACVAKAADLAALHACGGATTPAIRCLK